MGVLSTISYWVAFAAAWSGLRSLIPAGTRLRIDRWSVVLWCAVAVPSLLQTVVPAMLELGQRQQDAILAGQWWRLITSMFLQDGGWVGTATNLAVLGVSLVLVRAVVSGPIMVAIFLCGGVLSNVLTMLTFAQTGAGNSMATMFLVTVVLVDRLAGAPGRMRPAPVISLVLISCASVELLVVHDRQGLAIHGLALASGLVIGAATAIWHRITARRAREQ